MLIIALLCFFASSDCDLLFTCTFAFTNVFVRTFNTFKNLFVLIFFRHYLQQKYPSFPSIFTSSRWIRQHQLIHCTTYIWIEKGICLQYFEKNHQGFDPLCNLNEITFLSSMILWSMIVCCRYYGLHGKDIDQFWNFLSTKSY